MDPHTQRSGIPRPSKLPLPRASAPKTLRPSPSLDRLHADQGLDVSRLRRPSRDQLRVSKAQGTDHTPHFARSTSIVAPQRKSSAQKPTSIDKAPPQRQLSENPLQHADTEGETGASNIPPRSDDSFKTPLAKRKPRPSLSDRTIETLAQMPPSPSPARRKSGFVPPQSPMGPPSRPTSAMSNSRPSSTLRNHAPIISRSLSPTKQPRVPRVPSSVKQTPSSNRRPSLNAPRILAARPSREVPVSGVNGPKPQTKVHQLAPVAHSEARAAAASTKPGKSGSKSMVVRSSKPRPSLAGAFRQPSEGSSIPVKPEEEPITSLDSTPLRSSPGSRKVPRSSLNLRETIAMAKAARKASKTSNVGVDGSIQDDDPFNQITNAPSKGLLLKRVEGARTTGHLNIAAMGLSDIPDEVMNMYEFDPDRGGEWCESVDLVKLVAADNEIEAIRADAFPDTDPHEMANDNGRGFQFGGLETLDFHGNLLRGVPLGFQRLQKLRVLNLSNNKLDADALQFLCRIESLTEMRLSNNAIDGALTDEISRLRNLETLDLHGNMLSAIPDALADLVKLRILQLADNKISLIPPQVLCKPSLVEIVLSKNKLHGTLIPPNVEEFGELQILNVANNNLTALSDHAVDLPKLQQLIVDCNRLTELPDISSWKSLVTLAAEDNKLKDFPPGFTSLGNLRNADFTGNDLSRIDERIALMENLSGLRLASNPLRERKFLTMDTEDLKRDLQGRLAPSSQESANDNANSEWALDTPTEHPWPVKPGGILDRTSTELSSLEESDLEMLSSKHDIRALILHHNLLTEMPGSLSIISSTLTSLDLSHNKLGSQSSPLRLPHLQSLNISSNGLTDSSILDCLSAPLLAQLDISCNQLASLPRFRKQFPELVTVIAYDNSISELEVEAVKGLRALDVSRNDIGYLEPKLGLLEGQLRSLEVNGNRFRVPRWTILEKGTEAVLAWLKDKIPADETESVSSVD